MKMSPAAKLARAKYMREWRKKNPEKQREYAARMWEKKAGQNMPANGSTPEGEKDVRGDHQEG